MDPETAPRPRSGPAATQSGAMRMRTREMSRTDELIAYPSSIPFDVRESPANRRGGWAGRFDWNVIIAE